MTKKDSKKSGGTEDLFKLLQPAIINKVGYKAFLVDFNVNRKENPVDLLIAMAIKQGFQEAINLLTNHKNN